MQLVVWDAEGERGSAAWLLAAYSWLTPNSLIMLAASDINARLSMPFSEGNNKETISRV